MFSDLKPILKSRLKFTTLFIALIFCSISSEITKPSITGTEQNWYGRVCFRKVSNYQVTFKLKNQKAPEIIIQKICLTILFLPNI